MDARCRPSARSQLVRSRRCLLPGRSRYPWSAVRLAIRLPVPSDPPPDARIVSRLVESRILDEQSDAVNPCFSRDSTLLRIRNLTRLDPEPELLAATIALRGPHAFLAALVVSLAATVVLVIRGSSSTARSSATSRALSEPLSTFEERRAAPSSRRIRDVEPRARGAREQLRDLPCPAPGAARRDRARTKSHPLAREFHPRIGRDSGRCGRSRDELDPAAGRGCRRRPPGRGREKVDDYAARRGRRRAPAPPPRSDRTCPQLPRRLPPRARGTWRGRTLAIATSAVRDAENGDAFLGEIEWSYGFTTRLLEGARRRR